MLLAYLRPVTVASTTAYHYLLGRVMHLLWSQFVVGNLVAYYLTRCGDSQSAAFTWHSKQDFNFHIGATQTLDLALVSPQVEYPAGLPPHTERYKTSRNKH